MLFENKKGLRIAVPLACLHTVSIDNSNVINQIPVQLKMEIEKEGTNTGRLGYCYRLHDTTWYNQPNIQSGH
jgi:hypothetical protein